MKVDRIFEIINGGLYSAKFRGEDIHAFQKIFQDWSDTEFLNDYFERYHREFELFWPEFDLRDAISETINEADLIREEILRVAKYGQLYAYPNLSDLFKPLHSASVRIEEFEKSKWKPRRNRWLRIYAVRLGVNHYVITGGAIKLTKTMNETDELKHELTNLECVCRYFRERGVLDLGFEEIIQF